MTNSLLWFGWTGCVVLLKACCTPCLKKSTVELFCWIYILNEKNNLHNGIITLEVHMAPPSLPFFFFFLVNLANSCSRLRPGCFHVSRSGKEAIDKSWREEYCCYLLLFCYCCYTVMLTQCNCGIIVYVNATRLYCLHCFYRHCEALYSTQRNFNLWIWDLEI